MDSKLEPRDRAPPAGQQPALPARTQLTSRVFRRVRAVLTALLVSLMLTSALAIYQASRLPFLEAPDKFTYDWRHVLLGKSSPASRPDIAVLMISDNTLANCKTQQPIDRGLLARLVAELDQAGASAIGLDFIFDRPTDTAKDDALASAIASLERPGQAGRAHVVLGAIDNRSSSVRPGGLEFQAAFRARAGNPALGHLYFDRKHQGLGQPDLVVRWMARRSDSAGSVATGFAEALILAAGKRAREIGQSEATTTGADVGPHISWLAAKAIDGADTFATLDVPTVVPDQLTCDPAIKAALPSAAQTPATLIPANFQPLFKNRMVIIGGKFEDRDRHLTPLSVVDGASMPGALIHAQIVAQLIDGRKLQPLSRTQELVSDVMLALVGFLLGYWRRLGGLWVYPVLVGLFVAAGSAAFALADIIVPSDTAFYSVFLSIFLGRHWPRVRSRTAWLFGRASAKGA